jgi:hypothetical protein
MTAVLWIGAVAASFLFLARAVMRCRWFEDKSR